MTKLYITEFGGIGPAGIPIGPPVASQAVTIGATANLSAAFNDLTGAVRLHTDVVCSVSLVGVATANSARMQGNTTEFWPAQAGKKLSVISNT